jgi:hypothetical protein
MARSVYVPSAAAQVVYADGSDIQDSDDFDYYVDEAVYALKAKYPSLAAPSRPRYFGNEGRVILENQLVSIVLSEYCGLVAISVVPEDRYSALAERFANQISLAPAAQCFGDQLSLRGRFSNGEGVYARV